MKVRYDREADAAFIRFADAQPEGGIDLGNGVIVHFTPDNRLVALEILDASEKLDVADLFRFEIESQADAAA